MSSNTARTPPDLSRSAAREAAALIRVAILEGRLEPGERLKEQNLAEQFGISRTPIREALLFLEAEGVVTLTPNRGARVRDYSIAEIEDVYDLRALLEGHACRLAAGRIEATAVEHLRLSNDRFVSLRAGRDLVAITEENNRFHNTILDAAGSQRLTHMVNGVIELPLVYKSFFWYSADQKQVSEHYHGQIATALARGDAERAELVMKEHVFEGRDFLVARLQEESRRDG